MTDPQVENNPTRKPYYEDAWSTIYHGDCREILPALQIDTIVTDPPYGINLDTDYSSLTGSADFNRTHGHYAGKTHAPVHSDDGSPAPGWGGSERPCPSCGAVATSHDPCLGRLPGCSSACCGHGVHGAYIVAEEDDDTCAACGCHTMERSRNGYCSRCAEEHEHGWFDDEGEG